MIKINILRMDFLVNSLQNRSLFFLLHGYINPTCDIYEQYGQTHFDFFGIIDNLAKILSLLHSWFKIHNGFFQHKAVNSKKTLKRRYV